MITKLELKENFNNYNNSLIIIDFINKNIIQIKNDVIIIQKQIENTDELINLIKLYTIYWEQEYIDNTVIGGTEAQINIYTAVDLIKYSFKNRYPTNYYEFIKTIKKTGDLE